MDKVSSGLFKQNLYKEIREILQRTYPGVKGFCTRSIKQFCDKEDIPPSISQDLEEVLLV